MSRKSFSLEERAIPLASSRSPVRLRRQAAGLRNFYPTAPYILSPRRAPTPDGSPHGPRVYADAAIRLPNQLPARKPVRLHHRAPVLGPGAFLFSGRKAFHHASIRLPDPDRIADFDSLADAAPPEQRAGLRRFVPGPLQLCKARGHIRGRNDGSALV